MLRCCRWWPSTLSSYLQSQSSVSPGVLFLELSIVFILVGKESNGAQCPCLVKPYNKQSKNKLYTRTIPAALMNEIHLFKCNLCYHLSFTDAGFSPVFFRDTSFFTHITGHWRQKTFFVLLQYAMFFLFVVRVCFYVI